eukprot:PhF_6_TR27968/c0_g1_i1/m.41336
MSRDVASILEAPPKALSEDETDLMIFKGGKWVNALPSDTADAVTFDQIKFFYANIIDYFRVFMCVWASFAINWDQPVLAGILIICQQLLDWIDGPVARHFGQCSIFGSGVDWLADIMGQVIAMCWWVKLQPSVLPWLTIATTVEVTTCIFDFAVTATGKYPIVKQRTGFFLILNYAMPNGGYTKFGTFLWLAYPVYVVFKCWELSFPQAGSFYQTLFLLNNTCLMVPSILYIWCEAAYGSSIISRWTELSRVKRPHSYNGEGMPPYEGISHIGVVAPKYLKMLEKIYTASIKANKASFDAAMDAKTHFWYSIFQRNSQPNTGEKEFPITQTGELTTDNIFENDEEKKELLEFVETVKAHAYPEEDCVCDGFGFIVNGKSTNRTQKWHLDYNEGYSTTFIPLIQVSPENIVQYVLPSNTIPREVWSRALADPNDIDIDLLLKEGQVCSVRQVYARAGSMLRMGFGCVHRGVANRSGVDRPMFFVSMSKRGYAPPPHEKGFVAVDDQYLVKETN